MKINLIKLKNISRATIKMPSLNKQYKWYEGNEEISKKNWLGINKVIQKKVEPGWTGCKEKQPSYTYDHSWLDRYNLFIKEGQVWDKGFIYIYDEYNNCDKIYFDDPDFIDELKKRMGNDFIEIK